MRYRFVYRGGVYAHLAADLLRTARAMADLSQRELAARAGVPQPMIAAYESGARQPSVPTLGRLLDAAGYELRIRLEPPDQQSRMTAQWEAEQPQEWRDAWAREQRHVSSRR